MSYILDALRRADAERERGAVPSIHAQQQYNSVPGDGEPARRRNPTPWIIGALVVALAAAIAWGVIGSRARAPLTASTPTPPTPVASAPSSTTTPSVATAPATTVPAPSGTASAAAPTPTAATSQAAPKPTAERSAARRTTARAKATDEGRPNATERRATDANPPRTTGRRAGAEASPRDAKPVVALRDLPDAVRRELPSVKIGGSTYSTNQSRRMVMINDQIFHEGDAIARGLVLDQIRPKSAVFDFKGYRYEIAF